MIRTVITPRENTICLSISGNYIGKKVENLLYTSDEVKDETSIPDNNVARFKGILTGEGSDKYHQYLQKARQEWDRSI